MYDENEHIKNVRIKYEITTALVQYCGTCTLD